MVDPRHFAPFNLGDIMQQGQQMRLAEQDRAFRQQAFEQQQADRSEDRQMRMDDRQRKQAEAELDEYGAALAWADTPEKFDQAVDFLSRKKPELIQYRGQFQKRGQIAMELGALREMLANQPKQADGFTLGLDQVRFGPDGRPIAQGPESIKYHNVPEGTMAVPVGGTAPQAGFDAIMQNWILPTEGGFAANDGGSGHPVNFGINQGANPDIDVKSLTPEKAKQLYMQRYWKPSGADRLPPELQAIHFDTAVNMGVGKAQQLLAQSGGDPARYLQLREQRYRQIGGSNLPAWLERNKKLAEFGGMPAGAIVNPKAPKASEGNFQVLSDAEAQQMGLPSGKWQRGPNGKIDQIGSNTGQGGATRQQIGAAKQKLNALRPIEGQLARVEKAMAAAEKDGWTGWVGGMVPGRFDKESNVFDKTLRNLATLIRQLTRTPGEGAMSDYESRLAEAILPTRTDTPEGRAEAIAGIKDLISNIRSGYEDFLGQPVTQSGGWGAATVVGD